MLRTLLLLVFAFAAHAQPLDGRLKRIADTKTVNVGVRADAMPFSFIMAGGAPEGFMVDLCQRVVRSIASQLKIPELKVNWVLVTVQSRFDVVAKGNADMECGSSTITLSRLRQVDFSSITFVESTGVLVKASSGARKLADLAGGRIGVIRGTTNERAVAAQVRRRQLNVTLVPFASSEEAMAALEAERIVAFASDRLLLVGALARAKDPKAMSMLPEQLSIEPYGIVLPRGDSSLRLAVNTALSQIYAGAELDEIFRRWFGQFGPPPAIIEAAYVLGTIPD